MSGIAARTSVRSRPRADRQPLFARLRSSLCPIRLPPSPTLSSLLSRLRAAFSACALAILPPRYATWLTHLRPSPRCIAAGTSLFIGSKLLGVALLLLYFSLHGGSGGEDPAQVNDGLHGLLSHFMPRGFSFHSHAISVYSESPPFLHHGFCSADWQRMVRAHFHFHLPLQLGEEQRAEPGSRADSTDEQPAPLSASSAAAAAAAASSAASSAAAAAATHAVQSQVQRAMAALCSRDAVAVSVRSALFNATTGACSGRARVRGADTTTSSSSSGSSWSNGPAMSDEAWCQADCSLSKSTSNSSGSGSGSAPPPLSSHPTHSQHRPQQAAAPSGPASSSLPLPHSPPLLPSSRFLYIAFLPEQLSKARLHLAEAAALAALSNRTLILPRVRGGEGERGRGGEGGKGERGRGEGGGGERGGGEGWSQLHAHGALSKFQIF